MHSKRILVLANSIKRHARCVAGRDVGVDGEVRDHGWIRPISDIGHGELEPRHMACDCGGPLRVLEIVDVPLTRHAADRVHPEDWHIDLSQRWRKIDKLDAKRLLKFEEFPSDLWLETPKHTERVSPEFLARRQNHHSLYLIRPINLRIELTQEHNEFQNKDQKKTRATFIYNRQAYKMGVTDPEFTTKYCKEHPELGEPAKVFRPPFLDHCLLCVSVTPLFNGYHYKVIATIIPLP